MKIVIDARWIFPEISGIGAYTRELIKHLAVLDRENEYVLLFDNAMVRDRTCEETSLAKAPNFKSELIPHGVFSLRGQISLPGRLKRQKADIYHSTNYMIPLLAFSRHFRHTLKCVVTVHDMIPLILPKQLPKSRKTRILPVFRWLIREIGLRADMILSDSDAARADVARHLAIPPRSQNKLRTVYCGVSERFHPLRGKEPKSSDSKDPRTILYVGRSDPYKNIATLVCALAIAKKKAPFPLRLLIAGAPDPRYPEAKALAKELNVEPDVVWTGYLSDEELVKTYQQADILAHASRYEGFGLQVMEAMACGIPVVCSNAGSLPEVTGDAAILLDPDDAKAFAGRIEEVLTNQKLWKAMSEKGVARAAQFTWQKTAQETLTVYKELKT